MFPEEHRLLYLNVERQTGVSEVLNSSYIFDSSSGMDRRAKVNLREEAAGGSDAGLPEGAGHVQQQVRNVQSKPADRTGSQPLSLSHTHTHTHTQSRGHLPGN